MHAVAPALATSPALERSIRILRRRSVLRAFAEQVGRALLVALLLAGAVVLIARGVDFGTRTAHAAFLAAGAALAGAFVLWRATRSRPETMAAAVWLDVHSGASGAVVTESELGASPWSQLALAGLDRAVHEFPRPPWLRATREGSFGALFAALALFVPIRELKPGPPPVVADRAIERLEEKLDALEAALALDPELAEELHARVERIEETAASDRPDATFEAIDRLDERLDAEAKRALDAAQQAAEQLARSASDPHLEHADEALQSALSSLRDAGLTKGLSAAAQQQLGATLQLPPGVQLSSLELAQLSKALNQATLDQLAKLASGRMLDAKALERLAQAGLGEPGEFGELDPDHVCDENCRKPGGT